jgi:hypothetical protein
MSAAVAAAQFDPINAVWIVNNERLFSTIVNTLRDDVVRIACFLLNNGATDLAVEILQQAVSEKNISFDDLQKDPLFNYLRRKILLLFNLCWPTRCGRRSTLIQCTNKFSTQNFQRLIVSMKAKCFPSKHG